MLERKDLPANSYETNGWYLFGEWPKIVVGVSGPLPVNPFGIFLQLQTFSSP